MKYGMLKRIAAIILLAGVAPWMTALPTERFEFPPDLREVTDTYCVARDEHTLVHIGLGERSSQKEAVDYRAEARATYRDGRPDWKKVLLNPKTHTAIFYSMAGENGAATFCGSWSAEVHRAIVETKLHLKERPAPGVPREARPQ